MTLASILVVLIGNFLFLNLYNLFMNNAIDKIKLILTKYLSILMRVNALFIGAIAIEMLITGFENISAKKLP